MAKQANVEEDAPKKRQHRKKREKLVKKQKFKKNKKKFKVERQELRAIKKEKDQLRKMGYIGKAFAEKVPADKIFEIRKIVRRLLQHN